MFILLPMDGMLHGMWELLRSKVCWPSELHDPTHGEGSDACLKILYREKLTAGSHTGSLKKHHSWTNLILFSKIAMRSGEMDWLTIWIIACRQVHQQDKIPSTTEPYHVSPAGLAFWNFDLKVSWGPSTRRINKPHWKVPKAAWLHVKSMAISVGPWLTTIEGVQDRVVTCVFGGIQGEQFFGSCVQSQRTCHKKVHVHSYMLYVIVHVHPTVLSIATLNVPLTDLYPDPFIHQVLSLQHHCTSWWLHQLGHASKKIHLSMVYFWIWDLRWQRFPCDTLL